MFKNIFALLALISICVTSHAQVPVAAVEAIGDEASDKLWAIEELHRIGVNLNDFNLIDVTFPCKIVYQSTADNKPHVFVPESAKQEMLCWPVRIESVWIQNNQTVIIKNPTACPYRKI